VYNQLPMPTQPGHPSAGMQNEHDHRWGENGELCVKVGLLPGMLAY